MVLEEVMNKKVLILGKDRVECKNQIKREIKRLCLGGFEFFSLYCFDRLLDFILEELKVMKTKFMIKINVFYTLNNMSIAEEVPDFLKNEIDCVDTILVIGKHPNMLEYNQLLRIAEDKGKQIIHF